MAKKYYIAASKGGAGATTVCAGLGFALAADGERTLIVDGDSRCGCALAVCGCKDMYTFTLADYEKGRCRAKQAAVQHPKCKNLYIMPTLGCSDGRAAEDAIAESADLFDYVLCDGVALNACGQALMITEPYLPSVRAADVKAGEIKDSGAKVCGVIINKVNGGLVISGKIAYPEEIAMALNAPLCGVLPEDLALTLGKWRPRTIRCFKLAAARLKGKNAKLPYLESGYTGAGGYFRRRMRERI